MLSVWLTPVPQMGADKKRVSLDHSSIFTVGDRLKKCIKFLRSRRVRRECAIMPSSPTSHFTDLEKLNSGVIPGDTLGFGGFSIVTFEIIGGIQIAKKKISFRSSRESQNVLEEVDILIILRDHPNIITIQDWKICDLYGVIFMRFAGRRTLIELIEEGAINHNVAFDAIRGVATALAFVHEMGIMHLDVKCDNVIVSDGEIGISSFKLADFGLSKKGTMYFKSCGSVSYAAPEVLMHNPNYNGQISDVWGFGVIVTALFTGRLPFDAATAKSRSYCKFQGLLEHGFSPTSALQNTYENCDFFDIFETPIGISFLHRDILNACLCTAEKRNSIHQILKMCDEDTSIIDL